MTKVRNTGTTPIPVAGIYLLGGEFREVDPRIAQQVYKLHPDQIVIVENEPYLDSQDGESGQDANEPAPESVELEPDLEPEAIETEAEPKPARRSGRPRKSN